MPQIDRILTTWRGQIRPSFVVKAEWKEKKKAVDLSTRVDNPLLISQERDLRAELQLTREREAKSPAARKAFEKAIVQGMRDSVKANPQLRGKVWIHAQTRGAWPDAYVYGDFPIEREVINPEWVRWQKSPDRQRDRDMYRTEGQHVTDRGPPQYIKKPDRESVLLLRINWKDSELSNEPRPADKSRFERILAKIETVSWFVLDVATIASGVFVLRYGVRQGIRWVARRSTRSLGDDAARALGDDVAAAMADDAAKLADDAAKVADDAGKLADDAAKIGADDAAKVADDAAKEAGGKAAKSAGDDAAKSGKPAELEEGATIAGRARTAMEKETGVIKQQGAAGEAAALHHFERVGQKPYDLNQLSKSKNFPLIDVATDSGLSSVKVRVGKANVKAYEHDFGRLLSRNESKNAAEKLLQQRAKLQGEGAWPKELGDSPSVDKVAGYIRQKADLMIPSDQVEAVRGYIAQYARKVPERYGLAPKPTEQDIGRLISRVKPTPITSLEVRAIQLEVRAGATKATSPKP